MKLISSLLVLVIMVGVGLVGYMWPREPVEVVKVITTPECIVYTPFPEVYLYDDPAMFLPINQTIKSSLDAAFAHRYWYEQGFHMEHHLYWEKVHLSAAYYLQEMENEK